MEFLTIIAIFICGTIFGSLGSVLLTRLDETTNRQTIKGILFGFSRCPHCKKRLHAENLIPIVSYLLQKGKCAHCKKPISAIYPLLEISTGIIFVLSYLLVYHMLGYLVPDTYKLSTLIFRCITNRTLLLMIIHDIKDYSLHMPTRILSTLWVLGRQFLRKQGDYKQAVIGSLLFGAIFLGIYIFAKRYAQKRYHQKQEGFGEGDIYIGFLLGALSPFVAMYNLLQPNLANTGKILIALLIISSLLGLVYFGIKTLIDKYFKIGSKITIGSLPNGSFIPFIPALLIGFWILLYKADKIIPLLFK